MASGLFQITSELDEDLRVITDEPTEETAMRIANRYLRDPIDAFIDHNNHSALEYKELANKSKATYSQLMGNEWFKWGAGEVAHLMACEDAHERKIQAQDLAERKAKGEAAEKERNERMAWCGPLAIAIFIIFIVSCNVFYEAGKSDKSCPNCNAIHSLGYSGNNSTCSNCREEVQ
jgi:hypothetical protein